MDPVMVSLLNIKGYVFLWLFAIATFTLFGLRVSKFVRILKKAQPEKRIDNLFLRMKNFVVYVLFQKRLFDEKSIGLPHFLFFWGFVFYAASFGWNLIRGLFPFIPIPYSDDISIISFSLEIFGVLVLISIVIAVIRRMFFPPPHLQKSRDAGIILSLISLLMITLILGQGFKAADTAESTVSPIAGFVGSWFSGIEKGTLLNLSAGMWWIHIVTVLFFIVYIPYSKHMHLLTSPINAFLLNDYLPANLSIQGSLDKITEGSSKWDEFTWKQIFQTLTCAECGRCDRVCPALNSGYSLSPRLILHNIKEHIYETELQGKAVEEGKPLIGGWIKDEELWQCTSCMACIERCPVLNEHLSNIIQMRRYLVNQGQIEPQVQDLLMKVTRYGNSFGQSERNRPKWAASIEPKLKDVRKEEAEYLWVTGDYAAFDPRLQNITQTTAKIFQSAGLDFGILYEAEKNSGNDIRRIGEEGLFEILKEKNINSYKKGKFKNIVTTDPHTYNTLKNEYNLNMNGNGNGSAIKVFHHTEVLYDLIMTGKIIINKKLNYNVTYQDPCYLGRYNGIYEQPRNILKALGLNLIEMDRNRKSSYCCGAGGGRIWMEDNIKIKERPSENRIREAIALDNVKVLVVSCPKDIIMFQDAIKTTGNEGKIVVKEIVELIREAVEIQ
jgi:Fe-S oxidoreductase/nitrate reductase gamma subunit